MVLGVQNSLNMTLSRINDIENNFAQLASLSGNVNSIAQNQQFQTILDAKIKEAEPTKAEEKPEIDPERLLDNEIEELEKQINLKSKIDLKSQSSDLDEIIDTFASKYDVDSDFIKAIIKRESNFNPKATSKKGAMGLMQLMPSTAKSLGVINAYNPWENIDGGVKHLSGLLKTYNGDKKLALAAYNAGGGAVKKYGGIPPYKETQNYVKSIMADYDKIKGAKIWYQEELKQ